jgi:hypothetical protein
MSTRKDFSQVALDVMRKATGEHMLTPEQIVELRRVKGEQLDEAQRLLAQKQTAPKVTKGAAKKAAKKR